MKKIQIYLLLLSFILFSMSRAYADETYTTGTSQTNPFECIMTKWLIEYKGFMPLDMLQSYMSDLGQACNTSGNSIVLGGKDRYPGCDTDDIVLENGQIWSACNVGASVAYTGVVIGTQNAPLATDRQVGRFFQWGEMYGWDSDGGLTSSDNIVYPSLQPGKSSMLMDSSNTEIGGVNRWGITGSMQGPCEGGYHVPSKDEWSAAYALLELTPNNTEYTLRLPRSGMRNDVDGWLYGFSTNSTYWSSSPYTLDNQNAWTINFAGYTNPMTLSARNQGYPIRCIKDGTEYIVPPIDSTNSGIVNPGTGGYTQSTSTNQDTTLDDSLFTGIFGGL